MVERDQRRRLARGGRTLAEALRQTSRSADCLPLNRRNHMRRSFPQSIFAVLAAPVLFFAASASAAPSADSCGNIALVATGECHLEVTGGCEAKCTPLTLQAACDGQ